MVECKLIDRERRDIPKIVVVGDEKIGKSTLIAHLLGLDKNLQPVSNGGGCYFTILDNVVAPIPHEPVMSNAGEQLTGSSFLASIWDTCGEEGYDRLRPLVYPDTELFIVCFSVVDRTSFDHVMEKWDQETRFFCPTANKILVGLKTDVRDGQTYHDCSDSDDDEIAMEKPGLHAVSNHVQDTVTTKQGQESGRLLDDWWYTEGEALTGKGLEHIGDLIHTACHCPKELDPVPRCTLGRGDLDDQPLWQMVLMAPFLIAYLGSKTLITKGVTKIRAFRASSTRSDARLTKKSNV